MSAVGPAAKTIERMPPCNLDAERAILGAILLDREALGQAREKIAGPEFYRKEHRLIFAVMCELYETDQALGLPDFENTQSLQSLADKNNVR